MKKEVGTIIPFRKNPEWNVFHVYDEMPRAKQANIEMKALCDKFASDFRHLSLKYRKEGLDDSDSRYSVIRYTVESLDPIRKALRLREEDGRKKLPMRK